MSGLFSRERKQRAQGCALPLLSLAMHHREMRCRSEPRGGRQNKRNEPPTINRQSTCEKIVLPFFIHPLEHSPRKTEKTLKILYHPAEHAHGTTPDQIPLGKHQNQTWERVFYLVELITPTPIYFVLAAGWITRKGFFSPETKHI